MKKLINFLALTLIFGQFGFGQGDHPNQIEIVMIGDGQVINCTSEPARIGVEIQGWVEGMQYQWSTGQTDSIIDVKPNTTSVYSLTVSNASLGFNATRVLEVKVLNAPVFADDESILIDGSTCPGRDLELAIDPSGGYAPYVYEWNFGSTLSSPIVKPIENTSYAVTITDACGSTALANVDVNFTPHAPLEAPRKVELSFDCEGDLLAFMPDLNEVVGGVGYGYQFSADGWETVNEPIKTEASNGKSIAIQFTDACGIQFQEAELIMNQLPLEVPEISSITTCIGETVELAASSDEFYYWDGSVMHAQFEKTIDRNQTFTLKYIDRCGFERPIDRIVTVEEDKSDFDFHVFHSERKAQVAAIIQEEGMSYRWLLNGKPVGTDAEAEVSLTGDGANDITLETESERGCEASTTREVIVQDGIRVANAISPNGDGLNDYFTVEFQEPLAAFHVKIFDRWGQLIYQSNDQYFRWSSKDVKGTDPLSTFAYLIKAETTAGEIIEKRGTITSIYAN